MTSRAHRSYFVFVLMLSGCQTGSSLLPWQTASEPRYTAEELALHNNPQPAAARPQLAESMLPKAANATNSSNVVAAAPPIAAGRVDQLIQSGQAAIREAGQGDSAKLDEARQIFTQVLTVDNNNSSAHHGMAIVADLQKDWPAAERHYKQALQQRPQDPSLLNDLGYSYVLQNRYAEASKYLNEAVQLSPQHERAHINLALLSLKQGDRNGAQAQLAAVYSASEINNTLAKLEQDLQQSRASEGTRIASLPAQNAMEQSSVAQANRPVHVYPQGIGGAVAAQPPQNFSAGSRPQSSQPPSINTASYGDANQAANQLRVYNHGQQPNPGIYNNSPQGTPVGGMIISPNTGGLSNQYGGQPSGNQQYGNVPNQPGSHQNGMQRHGMNAQPLIAGPTNTADLQAPIAGLNAGPGTLFPLGLGAPAMATPQPGQQQQFAQAPSQYMLLNGSPPQQGYQPSQGMQAPQNFAPTAQSASPSTNGQLQDNRPISILPGEMPQQQGGNFYQQTQPPQVSPVSASQYGVQPQYGGPQPSGNMIHAGGLVPQNGAQANYQNYNNAPQPQMGMPPQTGMNPQQFQSYNGGGAPGSNTPAARLQAFDAQLQQNNNQYNQAIQQMNGNQAAFGNGQQRF